MPEAHDAPLEGRADATPPGDAGAGGQAEGASEIPHTDAGRQWWQRRGGRPPFVGGTLRNSMEERGFPHVDQWHMTPVHHLAPEERQGFAEVARGYVSEEEVKAEAARRLLCKHPTCISGCPNNNPIPTFLALVVEGKVLDAAVSDYEKNSLAACTGRVCNWEEQCEGWCVLNADGEGVRIGAVERYVGDYALKHPEELAALWRQRREEAAAIGVSAYTRPDISPYAAANDAYGGVAVPGYYTDREAAQVLAAAVVPGYLPEDSAPQDTGLDGFRVAAVGAGPAGLACADMLTRRRCTVVLFDSKDYAGAVMSDGIPEFVLPEDVVDLEIQRIHGQGATFLFGETLGEGLHMESLRQEYDAVFVGIGCRGAAAPRHRRRGRRGRAHGPDLPAAGQAGGQCRQGFPAQRGPPRAGRRRRQHGDGRGPYGAAAGCEGRARRLPAHARAESLAEHRGGPLGRGGRAFRISGEPAGVPLRRSGPCPGRAAGAHAPVWPR